MHPIIARLCGEIGLRDFGSIVGSELARAVWQSASKLAAYETPSGTTERRSVIPGYFGAIWSRNVSAQSVSSFFCSAVNRASGCSQV